MHSRAPSPSFRLRTVTSLLNWERLRATLGHCLKPRAPLLHSWMNSSLSWTLRAVYVFEYGGLFAVDSKVFVLAAQTHVYTSCTINHLQLKPYLQYLYDILIYY